MGRPVCMCAAFSCCLVDRAAVSCLHLCSLGPTSGGSYHHPPKRRFTVSPIAPPVVPTTSNRVFTTHAKSLSHQLGDITSKLVGFTDGYDYQVSKGRERGVVGPSAVLPGSLIRSPSTRHCCRRPPSSRCWSRWVLVEIGRPNDVGRQLLADNRAAVSPQRTTGIGNCIVIDLVVVRAIHCFPRDANR